MKKIVIASVTVLALASLAGCQGMPFGKGKGKGKAPAPAPMVEDTYVTKG